MPHDQPTDYPPLAPVLSVTDARKALQCYREAFEAEELYRLVDPVNGRWAHLEIRLPNGSLILLEEALPAEATPSGARPTRPRMSLCLFVAEVDRIAERCAAAGMAVLQPLQTHFHGHRCCRFRDPDGHEWMLSQAVESLRPSEMQARWDRRAAGKTRPEAPPKAG